MILGSELEQGKWAGGTWRKRNGTRGTTRFGRGFATTLIMDTSVIFCRSEACAFQEDERYARIDTTLIKM